MEDQKRLMLVLDRISNLPPCITETILCLLPTKEAVRTSILSPGWRYRWTKLAKFDFTEKYQVCLVNYTPQALANRKLFSVINQLISMHESPIQEFSLTTYLHGRACVGLDHLIDTFSRNNNLKKLRLDMRGYWIPESFYSLHKLTVLRLKLCHLDVPPTFSGFRSLTNLSMYAIKTTKRMLQLFLSGCPLLKAVSLVPDFGSVPDNDDSTLAQLFNCLPTEIESLTVSLGITQFYDQGRVPNQLPTAFVHLKHLCILDVQRYKYRFHCFVLLLRSCPNMEKLTLQLYQNIIVPGNRGDSCSDLWLGHLNEVEIYFSTEGNCLHSIRLILAKSPVLKKVKILFAFEPSKDDKLLIQQTFFRYPRISRDVEFIVINGALVI